MQASAFQCDDAFVTVPLWLYSLLPFLMIILAITLI